MWAWGDALTWSGVTPQEFAALFDAERESTLIGAELIVAVTDAIAVRDPGSRGSFMATAAAQRFGSESISKQQLKAAEETAENTAATAKALRDLARAWALR